MIDHDEAEQVLETDGHLFLAGGADAGPVQRIYLDDYSGWPSFCTILPRGDGAIPAEDGAGAGREVFVALHQAETVAGGVRVPYGQDKIDGAPQVLDGRELSISEEDALFDYYGVPIDDIAPVIEHLGAVLETSPHGDVTSRDVDHPAD